MKKCSVSDLIQQSFKLESCSDSEFDNWRWSCLDCLISNEALQERFRAIDFTNVGNLDESESSLTWKHGVFALCRIILSEFASARDDEESRACQALVAKESYIHEKFAKKEAYLRSFIPDLKVVCAGFYLNANGIWGCEYSGCIPAYVCLYSDGRCFEMHGAIYQTWSCYNVRTRIGFPLSDEESDGPNYQISRYEHGYIRWSRDSGVCDVFMEPSAYDYVDAYMKYCEHFGHFGPEVNYTVHCLPGELENEQSRQ